MTLVRTDMADNIALHYFELARKLSSSIPDTTFNLLFDSSGYLLEDALTGFVEINSVIERGNSNTASETNITLAIIFKAAIYFRKLQDRFKDYSNFIKKLNTAVFDRNIKTLSFKQTSYPFWPPLITSDAIALANILTYCTWVTSLSIPDNCIGDKGEEAIMITLFTNHNKCKITGLSIQRPRLEDIHLQVFTQRYFNNPNLTKPYAFVQALRTLTESDGSLLISFTDPQNQKVFDAILASVVNKKLTSGQDGFEPLTTEIRSAYLIQALSRWMPNDNEDENLKAKFQSQLLTTGFFATNSKQACETPSNTLHPNQPK